MACEGKVEILGPNWGAQYNAGDIIEVSIRITNDALCHSGFLTASLRQGVVELASDTKELGNIPMGSSQTRIFSLIIPGDITGTLELHADFSCLCVGDSHLSKTLIVVYSEPVEDVSNIVVDSVVVNPVRAIEGEYAVATAFVSNIGSGPGTKTIKFYLDGGYWSDVIVSVAPGQQVTVSQRVYSWSTGTHKVCADDKCASFEVGTLVPPIPCSMTDPVATPSMAKVGDIVTVSATLLDADGVDVTSYGDPSYLEFVDESNPPGSPVQGPLAEIWVRYRWIAVSPGGYTYIQIGPRGAGCDFVKSVVTYVEEIAVECLPSDFAKSVMEYGCGGTSSFLNQYCQETGGQWTLTIFADKPLEATRYGLEVPPDRTYDGVISGWKAGYELQRLRCEADGYVYWVKYPAILAEEGVCLVEGMTRCEGVNLQECRGGVWVTVKENASECGYRKDYAKYVLAGAGILGLSLLLLRPKESEVFG